MARVIRRRDAEILYSVRYSKEVLDKSYVYGYTIKDYMDACEDYDIVERGVSRRDFKEILGRRNTYEQVILSKFDNFI